MKQFRKMPIAYQFWLLAVFVLVILSGAMCIAYYRISGTLVANNISYTTNIFCQMKTSLEKQCDRMESLLLQTGHNRAAFKYLSAKNNTDRYSFSKELDSLALSASQLEASVQEFIIQGYNDIDYFSGGRTAEVLDALKTIPAEVDNYYQLTELFQYRARAKYCFLLTTQLRDIYNLTGAPDSGQISFVISLDFFEINDFQDQFDTGIYILNSDYNVRAQNRSADMQVELGDLKALADGKEEPFQAEAKIDGVDCLVNFDLLLPIDGYIVSVTPKMAIISDVYWVRDLTIILLAVAAALLILFFSLFSRNLTAPLSRLSRHMLLIGNGNPNVMREPIRLEGYREIENISDQFNLMISEIDQLNQSLFNTMKTLYDAEIQKKQTELLYLKSQINPHFLHNTLEVILGVAFTENAEDTAKMIKALSRIFRYSIRGADVVTVADEVKIAQAYIDIQQMRFYDKFRVECDFDDIVLQNHIPKMMLQPLIENAIIHGLEECKRDGLLKIGGAFESDTTTLLWVEDNGAGISEEQLTRLRDVITREDMFRSESVGFENVVYRLRLLYGDRCRIEIRSELGRGTRIEIRIPWLI